MSETVSETLAFLASLVAAGPISVIVRALLNQGSYRQVCVKFKDFSRTS